MESIDGRKLIALYGHVGEMIVVEGDYVNRGKLIARLGVMKRTLNVLVGYGTCIFSWVKNIEEKIRKEQLGDILTFCMMEESYQSTQIVG